LTACGRIDNFEALKRHSFSCPAPSESQVHPIARSKLSCRLHRQGDSNRGPLQSAPRTHFGKANRHHAQTNTQRRPGPPHSKKQTLLPVTPSRRLEPRFTPKCSSHPFWEGSGPSCPKPAPSEGQVHPIARSKLSCRLHRQDNSNRGPLQSAPRTHLGKANSHHAHSSACCSASPNMPYHGAG
jgi:hypothetical protein